MDIAATTPRRTGGAAGRTGGAPGRTGRVAGRMGGAPGRTGRVAGRTAAPRPRARAARRAAGVAGRTGQVARRTGPTALLTLLLLAATLTTAPPAAATPPGGNGRLALWRDATLHLANPDGSGHTTWATGEWEFPSVSPDGSRIATGRTNHPSQLWTIDADGSNATLLATDPLGATVVAPAWSPDGTRIAYSTDGCGRVVVVNVASGATQQVSADLEWFGTPTCRLFNHGIDWSPDGTKIAMVTMDHAEWIADNNLAQQDVVVIDVESRTEVNVTSEGNQNVYQHWDPSWSPDGTKIVSQYLSSDGFGGDLVEGLHVIDADGTDPHLVYDWVPGGATAARPEAADPTWSPDGTTIAFVGDPQGDAALWSVPAGGGAHQMRWDFAFGAPTLQWLPSAQSTDITLTTCDATTLGGITAVTGDLTFDLPENCDTLSLPNLTTVGGTMIVANAPTLTTLEMPALQTVGGNVELTCNVSLTTASMEQLSSVGGAMTVDGGMTGDGTPTLTTLDMPALETVGGPMTLTGDAPLTSNSACDATPAELEAGGFALIDAPSLTTVEGDVTVETHQQAFDIDQATITGDLSVTGDTTEAIAGRTPNGATLVQLHTATATMATTLATGTFAGNVGFDITAVTASVEAGTTAGGTAAQINPLAAYAFAFDELSLGEPALVEFSLDLPALSDETRSAVVAALQADTLTVAVKGGEPEDAFAGLPLCTSTQDPAADACVRLALLDANGDATTVIADAVTVQLTVYADHFSTLAAAIVTPEVASEDDVVVAALNTQRMGNRSFFADPDLGTIHEYLQSGFDFGTSIGTVPIDVVYDQSIETVTADALEGVDVFYSTAFEDFTAAEVAALQAFNAAGGALVITSNVDGLPLPEAFADTGCGDFSVDPITGNIDAPAHPIANGPFGTVSEFEQHYATTCFAPPAGATVVGNNPPGTWAGPSLVAIDTGAGATETSGRVVLVGSDEVFRIDLDDSGNLRHEAAVTNAVLIKNVFAYVFGYSAPAADDTTPPVVEYSLSPQTPDGDGGWHTGNVSLTWDVTEAESPNSLQLTGCEDQSITADQAATDYSCGATSEGGTSDPVAVTIKRDATDPTVSCATPAPAFARNSTGSVTATVSDATSGPAAATVAANADTSAVGSFTADVTGSDHAGNTTTVACPYSVTFSYDFSGFLSPVDRLPTRNVVKAGRAIPVKFRLGGDQGLSIFGGTAAEHPASTTPVSSNTSCSPAGTDTIEQTASGGASTLTYDAATDTYSYVWKTDARWANACRLFELNLADGSTHEVIFQFTK